MILSSCQLAAELEQQLKDVEPTTNGGFIKQKGNSWSTNTTMQPENVHLERVQSVCFPEPEVVSAHM